MIITPTPQTQLHLTIVLTEDEAREAIHTPDKLQTAIRKALADIRRADVGAISNRVGFFLPEKKMRGSTKKLPKGNGKPSGRPAFTKSPCPKCGRNIGSNQLSRHLNKCQGTAAPADSN